MINPMHDVFPSGKSNMTSKLTLTINPIQNFRSENMLRFIPNTCYNQYL